MAEGSVAAAAAAALTQMTALVFGATGATGRWLVLDLLLHNWRVVTIGRRPWTPALLDGEGADAATAVGALPPMSELETSGRLQQVEMPDMLGAFDTAAVAQAAADADACFYVLGTTKADAGSAERFRAIDFGITEATVKALQQAEADKHSRVRHFALLSSVGADPTSYFLYMSVKGQTEDLVKAGGFHSTSIFRPGLLGRGTAARTKEKIFKWLMGSMPVGTLASAMRVDAEQQLAAASAGWRIFSNSDISRMAKEEAAAAGVAGGGTGAAPAKGGDGGEL